jgi:competence protein ComFC
MLLTFLKEKLLESLFPRNCVSCGLKNTYFCEKCLNKTDREIKQPVLPNFVSALFPYKDKNIRKLIWFLKYKNIREIATIFSPFFLDLLIEISEENYLKYGTRDITLISIPTHKSKKNKKGYNQTEILIEEIVKQAPLYFKADFEILIKVKNTISQTKTKNKKERELNPKDSFLVSKKADLKNKNIILIDDVCTTGATLKEAKLVLEKAGARSVKSITIAH